MTKSSLAICSWLLGILCLSPLAAPATENPDWSVARQWNEVLLEAIRNDFARPTVHARNLYHLSAAMWDAWAAYDELAETIIHHEYADSRQRQAARKESISYAAYRLLKWRFANSPGVDTTNAAVDELLARLGYATDNTSVTGGTPAALGNRVAEAYIQYGLGDGANEAMDYGNLYYQPVNQPLLPVLPGNPDISDPNRWQPLTLEFFIDQAGRIIPGGSPDFLSPEWGIVEGFALGQEDLNIYQRDGLDYWVYHDPGPPPYMGSKAEAAYKAGFEQVAIWSGYLDPGDGVSLDISPAARGNNTLGSNDGRGYDSNPVTGQAYESQWVPAGDYYRVLAEFWADGPDSETPPGHWFTIANYVSDHSAIERRLQGAGPVLNELEWDLKLYLALGGAMHDAAISAWGVKGWYDYIRPVSAIRYMCDQGQASDPDLDAYNPQGINLYPGSIELITAESSATNARHAHLAEPDGAHLGKIALKAWRGPDFISDPAVDTAGVGWIRCENWWPYQRPSFVTPPFAGYVSGHSTYSRAAAEVLTRITGSEYFPGGLGEFVAPKNQFLVFEQGPSMAITLQWAKYYDAADECSLSRIYGGIHPPADDIPGRLMGSQIGKDAFSHALDYFNGVIESGLKPPRGFRELEPWHRRDLSSRRGR